jgi:hypothetical protein
MARRRQNTRTVVASERLASEVEELMTLARERGRASRRERRADPSPESPSLSVVWQRDRSSTQEILGDELRQLLEDEVVPAYPDDASFVESEFHREVIKKVLVGLHAATLRKVAQCQQLDKRGSVEQLAERIARAYRYDDADIARLILENEEEPQPDRGHVSRLFPMAREINVNSALEHINTVMGRVVRTGVARWLEIDEVLEAEAGEAATITARLRTYKAFVSDLGEEPTLGSSATEADVSIVLENGRRNLIVRGADASVSRIATRGIAGVIEMPLASGLSFGRALSGHLATFDERTVVLLDLVYSRLDRLGITDRNLTIARFVTEKGDQPSTTSPDGAGEHSLKAVRFEGHHLLDSPQACQLIALSGRGLVDISLWVVVPPLADVGGETPWFPVRFSLERDHIGVVTGFSQWNPERSLRLHEMLVEEVEAAISTGPADPEALEELAARIYRTARSGEPGSGTLRSKPRTDA